MAKKQITFSQFLLLIVGAIIVLLGAFIKAMGDALMHSATKPSPLGADTHAHQRPHAISQETPIERQETAFFDGDVLEDMERKGEVKREVLFNQNENIYQETFVKPAPTSILDGFQKVHSDLGREKPCGNPKCKNIIYRSQTGNRVYHSTHYCSPKCKMEIALQREKTKLTIN